jgi:hypothetical protein
LPGQSEQEQQEQAKEEAKQYVSQEAPQAFENLNVMDTLPGTQEMEIQSVDTDIAFFSEKIPQFQGVLDDLGITGFEDSQKLSGVQIALPSLSSLAFGGTNLDAAEIPSIITPIAELSTEMRQNIPTDMIFARSEGELIDYNINLAIDEKGSAQQKISTIVGQTVELVYKTDAPAKKVLGYIILKNKSAGQVQPENFVAMLARYFTAALTGSSFASQSTGLLLDKFEYSFVGDGIYKASVKMPAVDGQYEITTIVEYQDKDLAPKETTLIAVVDPEGYLHKNLPGRIKSFKCHSYNLLAQSGNF